MNISRLLRYLEILKTCNLHKKWLKKSKFHLLDLHKLKTLRPIFNADIYHNLIPLKRYGHRVINVALSSTLKGHIIVS